MIEPHSFDFLLKLDTRDRAKELLQQQVIEITDGFPAKDSQDFCALMLRLFKDGGISRIPIIGVKTSDGVRTFMLTTDHGIQQHAELAAMLGIEEDDFDFTSALEGLPSREIDDPKYFALMMKVAEKGNVVQKVKPGSDRFRVPLTVKGRNILGEIFSRIGWIAEPGYYSTLDRLQLGEIINFPITTNEDFEVNFADYASEYLNIARYNDIPTITFSISGQVFFDIDTASGSIFNFSTKQYVDPDLNEQRVQSAVDSIKRY